ncbi:DUF5107 domain-containing protein [bacterium]|nr:DUF5107 domain-containing protein [bacterium]
MISILAFLQSILRDWTRSRSARAVRWTALRPIPSWGWALCLVLFYQIHYAAAQPSAFSLGDYPRPPADNGWGVHWAPTLLSQPQAVVDRYLQEVDALDLKWLKIMQPDQARLEHGYLLAGLQARGIEPVLRVQKTYNDAYQHLNALVTSGVGAGVNYYELYNNPNVAGLDGGWRRGQPIDAALIARRWAEAARTVRAAGGYPGLPSLSPNGAITDTDFLGRFLDQLSAQGSLDALDGAWLPVQNYMGNRPLEDVNGFRKFERFHEIVLEKTGRTLPILTTEGGAVVGDSEDPRYPAITDQLVAERTAAAFAYMQSDAPDYYFAFMPWLLVNAAAGGVPNSWERHAWFPVDQPPRPVVDAVKHLLGDDVAPANPVIPSDDVQYAQQPAQADSDGVAQTPEDEVQAASVTMRPLDESAEQVSSVAAPPTSAPSPTPVADARTVSRGRVTVSEGSIELPTYDFQRALVPTSKDDAGYPAPQLDHAQVGAPALQRYRTIVVENDFMRLTLLPELGGRIYRWEDKQSGRDVLYHNPVVKPTPWGVRGWWLALGGMEWNFPLPDRGFYEYVPWRSEIVADANSAAVRLFQNGPKGLEVSVTVSLNADARFFAVTPELRNSGSAPLDTHFWITALLAPSATNSVDPNSRLVWPADGITVHSSAGTRSLPMGGTVDWPSGSGDDLSALATWPQHLGFFASSAPRQSAAGLVDPNGDLAVVRAFPNRVAPGLKTFYSSQLDPTLWTDGNQDRFFELWGGASQDFDTPITLQPQQSLRWTEQWYTVPGLGNFVGANAHAALALIPQAAGTELRLASTGSPAMQSMTSRLVVRVDDNIVSDEEIALRPDAIHTQLLPQRFDGRRWMVQLMDAQDRVLFAYDNRAPVAVAATVDESIEWDERLDELEIEVVPANVPRGQRYWKVIKAEFQTPEEGGGRHHIFVEVLDEDGKRIVGQPIQIHWRDGGAEIVTEDKPAPEYAANFPMYGNLGGYSVDLPGLSDTVTGMGLPFGRMHVVYNLVFQKTVKQ